MNRTLSNRIRYVMDEWLPPLIRDSRWFMYPFFVIMFKGRNVAEMMEFKSRAYEISDKEIDEIYRQIETKAMDRETDLNNGSVEWMFEQMRKPSATLLDVGCGRGFFVRKAVEAGYTVTGCDVLTQVSVAPGAHYVQSRAEKLPFQDKEFDIVVCSHTIEHLRDLPKAVAELKRVTRKQLVVVVPCQRYYYYTLDLHLQFFPLAGMLTSLFGIPGATIRKIDGDWVYIVDLEN